MRKQTAKTRWPISPRSCIAGRHLAFTLLEILLVLAILVILAGMSLPLLFNALQGHRLKISAQMIQNELMRARVDAMESGRVRMFRYETDTGNFKVAPLLRNSDELENNLAGTSQAIGISQEVFQSAEAEILEGTLEEGIVFAGESVEADMRSYSLGQEQGGGLEIAGWSNPVLFYPDGTTSDATVYLRDDGGTLISVQLRGLTGIARIVEPDLSAEGKL